MSDGTLEGLALDQLSTELMGESSSGPFDSQGDAFPSLHSLCADLLGRLSYKFSKQICSALPRGM